MSNMEKIVQKPFSGGAAQMSEPLLEYQQAVRQADESEALLEEYCSAIEDFGLDMPGNANSTRQIFCREKAYTPAQILQKAEQEAQRLEKLTAQASCARGRVLSSLLHKSSNLAEFRALRWLYVDSAEARQHGVDVFPPVQGKVS